jgi:hypothetical protein
MHTNDRFQRANDKEGGFLFEVNPLILQIVLWNESEIIDGHPKFTTISHPNRVAEICKRLFFREVAQVDFQHPPIWVPTPRIERDCGGSNILASSRFELTTSISAAERCDVARVINNQFRRRLKLIVKECVLAFESHNFGLTEINGLDDTGRIRWCIADARSGTRNVKKPLN